jgi:hypothetical protein
VHLRLTDRQFGDLTPRLFHMLLDRHREEVEHNKAVFGVLAATIANFSQRAPKRMLKPSDFFGGPSSETDNRVNRKEQVSNLRAFLMSRTTQTIKAHA